MNLNEIKILTRKLLDATYQLFVGPNTYKSAPIFARVAEGTFRRDYLTLYTMLYLAAHEKPEARTAFATSCMDLCRRIHEDLISLEYMLLKGKEKYARKFMNYKAVEAKRDIDYLEAVGAPIDPRIKKNTIDENYEKVKHQFLDNSSKARRKAWAELTEFLKSQGKIDDRDEQKIEEEFTKRYPNVDEQPRRAWAGLDVEDMTRELVKGGVINANEQRILIQTYLKGNQKNHFSPTDISVFLDNELYNQANDADLLLSLVVTTIGVTRIATIFADEVELPDETKQRIKEISQTLLAAHLSEDE